MMLTFVSSGHSEGVLDLHFNPAGTLLGDRVLDMLTFRVMGWLTLTFYCRNLAVFYDYYVIWILSFLQCPRLPISLWSFGISQRSHVCRFFLCEHGHLYTLFYFAGTKTMHGHDHSVSGVRSLQAQMNTNSYLYHCAGLLPRETWWFRVLATKLSKCGTPTQGTPIKKNKK